MLASLDDINVHLPLDKIEVLTSEQNSLQLDAERIVKGYLSGVFSPTTLAAWTDPNSTPGIIRAIAGRFIAAFYYRERYSEDSLDDPQYAQNKYNEAMAMIQQIITGTILVEGVPDADSGNLTPDMFWPNDTTEGPFFTMTMVK